MKKVTNFILGDYFKLPNPGLRTYLSLVERGNSEEYRTPFYNGKSLDAILSLWNAQLTTITNEWPTLYEFEKDLASKVGPLSIMKPLSERLPDVEAYYTYPKVDVDPIDARAIDLVCNEFAPISGLRIRSLSRTIDQMKKSTSSGAPFFRKRRDVVHETEELIAEGADFNRKFPAILGWRGQEGGPEPDDVKQRVVWMFPFSVNALELQLYQPLIEACQTHNLVSAWVSMDTVDARITQMFDTKDPEDLVICTDFSKFDQHFNNACQAAAHSILEYMLTPTEENKRWLQQVYPIKYNIPILCSDDLLYSGSHGMASGSGGTNADETLTHRALQHEAALKQGKKLNPNSQCLGDDGVLTYPGCTVEDVMHSYTVHGLEMNESKQYSSTQDCTYLRRWHHKDFRNNGICVGVYSTNRALGRLAEQERYYDPEKWSKEMVALRQLSIIENCKHHPLREEFAEFCMKGDKYRLGIDIPGFLDNISRIAERATDLIPDFMGYTKSMQEDYTPKGIKDWWIVQYLKSKQ